MEDSYKNCEHCPYVQRLVFEMQEYSASNRKLIRLAESRTFEDTILDDMQHQDKSKEEIKQLISDHAKALASVMNINDAELAKKKDEMTAAVAECLGPNTVTLQDKCGRAVLAMLCDSPKRPMGESIEEVYVVRTESLPDEPDMSDSNDES